MLDYTVREWNGGVELTLETEVGRQWLVWLGTPAPTIELNMDGDWYNGIVGEDDLRTMILEYQALRDILRETRGELQLVRQELKKLGYKEAP